MLNPDEFEKFMHELYEKFHMHDLKQTDRLQRYRNIEPESGRFLSMLICAQKPKIFWKLVHPQAIRLYG